MLLGAAIIVIVTIHIFVFIYYVTNRWKSRKHKIPCGTLIVLGSGGHTREMLGIVKSMSPAIYSPRLYVVAASDEFSCKKAHTLEKDRFASDYKIVEVYRTREVGQSWFTTIFSTLISLLQSIKVILQFQPKLILCNGPGLCVPICVVAYACRIVKLFDVKMVYVESICRVKSLSLSGRILIYIVDKFLKQWEKPEMGNECNIGQSDALEYKSKIIGRVS